MLDIKSKIKEMLQEHPDPREGEGGKALFLRHLFLKNCPPVAGVVTDNRDPECLGRVRICYMQGAVRSVSPWLTVIGGSRKKGSGLWALPEPGTQALTVFTSEDRSRGYVLGFIYDREHLPPEHKTEGPSEGTLLQGKTHRIEISDKEGSEEIRIESAGGEVSISIGKEGGIKVINGAGGINIKCRKLTVNAGKPSVIKGKKKVTFKSEESAEVKARKCAAVSGEKEVTLKGKNIRLEGTKGVTAEGKQLASKDDKVMGFDTHIMVVPAGSGTVTVPLPHPFIGKIRDGVSENVKIKGRGAAVKGSRAKHNDGSHMQLPGTIKFQRKPENEGEITGGTSSTVKINGKEAAVIGSLVTTCNDTGARNNSAVIAPGISIPMPVIVNPLNTEEWKREAEEDEKKAPEFINVKWSKPEVKEGEAAELTAGVKDIADGNMVTLQVFRRGESPESSIPLERFPLTVKDGSVSAKWVYRTRGNDIPPEEAPEFIFTAHSAWCKYAKSSNTLKVNLIRPEITKAEWHDKDGNRTEKGTVGKEIHLFAETKNIPDGEIISFIVKDFSSKREVAVISGEVKNGKAEAAWKVLDIRKKEDNVKLEYYFEVTAARCRTVQSEKIQVKNPRVISMEWNRAALYYGDKARLKIKTLELSDEKPVCKLVLYDEYFTQSGKVLLEKEIKIDKDETEEEIEFTFSLEDLKLTRDDLELTVFANLLSEDDVILNKEPSVISVGIGFTYE